MGPGTRGADGRLGSDPAREISSPPQPSPAQPLPSTQDKGVGATSSGISLTRPSEPSCVWGWDPRCPNSQEWCLGGDEPHVWAQRLGQHVVPELRSSCHQGPEEAGQEDSVPHSLSH